LQRGGQTPAGSTASAGGRTFPFQRQAQAGLALGCPTCSCSRSPALLTIISASRPRRPAYSRRSPATDGSAESGSQPPFAATLAAVPWHCPHLPIDIREGGAGSRSHALRKPVCAASKPRRAVGSPRAEIAASTLGPGLAWAAGSAPRRGLPPTDPLRPRGSSSASSPQQQPRSVTDCQLPFRRDSRTPGAAESGRPPAAFHPLVRFTRPWNQLVFHRAPPSHAPQPGHEARLQPPLKAWNFQGPETLLPLMRSASCCGSPTAGSNDSDRPAAGRSREQTAVSAPDGPPAPPAAHSERQGRARLNQGTQGRRLPARAGGPDHGERLADGAASSVHLGGNGSNRHQAVADPLAFRPGDPRPPAATTRPRKGALARPSTGASANRAAAVGQPGRRPASRRRFPPDPIASAGQAVDPG